VVSNRADVRLSGEQSPVAAIPLQLADERPLARGPIGEYGAHEWVTGRKRHPLWDGLGALFWTNAMPARVHDRVGARCSGDFFCSTWNGGARGEDTSL
jgi:hypothetical protein